MSPLTPEPSAPLYQTDLAQTPLPEILAKIHRYKAPGRIDCRRGEERVRISLQHGRIVLPGEGDESLWAVFGWTEGTASFTPGRDKQLEFVKTEVPIPRAVLRGVRFMPDPKALVAKLGSRTAIFEHVAGEVDPLSLEPDELQLYEAVDGRTPLGDLVARPPLSSADNARLLYAFLLLGMIAPRPPRPLTVKVRIGD